MKKTFLFLLTSILLLSSCKTSVNTNKQQGYDKVIENEISIYIAVIADGNSKIKFAEGLKEKLTNEFATRNITADVTILETEKGGKSHNFGDKDITTKNANGLTLSIIETSQTQYTRMKHYGFTMKLTDHHLKKDIWVTEEVNIPMGGIGSIPNAVSKIIFNSLKRDKLLAQ